MMLTIDLPDEKNAVLAAKARAQGVTAEQFARQLLEEALTPETKKPLAARIREIWADMPPEVRAKLPADGASQHDHYIYGVPKRTP
jgi:plasmid stability protein